MSEAKFEASSGSGSRSCSGTESVGQKSDGGSVASVVRTRSYLELSERYQMLVRNHEEVDGELDSLRKRNQMLEHHHGQVQGIEQQFAKHHKTDVSLLSTREEEERRSLKGQEDNSFLSIRQTLSIARHTDVDLQAVKTDNCHTIDLLDEARRREASATQQVRQANNERDLLSEKLADAKRECGDLRRQVTYMERKGASQEGLEQVERQEMEAEMRRLRAQVEELSGENELLGSQRAGLMREKQTLLEIQGHNNELEGLVQGYKDSHATMKSEYDHMQRQLDGTVGELQQCKARLGAQDGEEQKRWAHNSTVATNLREEITVLEARLQEAEGDKEARMQADMEVMLNMQNAAMERDAILLKMREEIKALQAQNEVLSQDREIAVGKLVTERQAIEELKTSVRTTGRFERSGSRQSATELVSTGIQAEVSPVKQEVLAGIGAMSLDNLKRAITRAQHTLIALQAEVETKTDELTTMRSMLHSRLHTEMEELDSISMLVSSAGLGRPKNSILSTSTQESRRSPQRRSPGRLGSLALSNSFTPDTREPSEVAKSYKKTEEDLQALRKKVSNLKLLQQQLDQGARLMSQPVPVPPVQTPASPYRSEASPQHNSAATAVANEYVVFSPSQHASEWSPRSARSPVPVPPVITTPRAPAVRLHSESVPSTSHNIMQRLLSCASQD